MITNDIAKIKSVLINNQLAAIPTETVYGLAGNALNTSALKQIFELKKRPFNNPLIIHLKSKKVMSDVAKNIPELAFKLADAFWPGPLTLILEKQNYISDLITAGKKTVAVRVPDHPLTLSLLESIDFPLAAPSANPFGSISPTSTAHVLKYFGNSLAILDGGECQRGIESTIVGFEGNQPILYRHGAISSDLIEEIAGKLQQVTNAIDAPIAPGMLPKHYSPETTTFLTSTIKEIVPLFEGKKIGALVFQDPIQSDSVKVCHALSKSGDLNEAAKKLYALLHELDSLSLDLILIEKLPEIGLGKTINDKLLRASSQIINRTEQNKNKIK